MDSNQLLQKLQTLKSRFLNSDPSDRSTIDGWIHSAERATIINHLAEHEGMRELLAMLRRDVADMETVLRNADSKTLPDYERDRVLDRRNLYQQMLGYFDNASTTLKEVETQLQRNKQWTE